VYVIHRKPGEEIRIGTDIRVMVLRHSHGGLRLAIEAPRHMTVTRVDPPRPPRCSRAIRRPEA